MKIKIEKLQDSELKARRIEAWPVWECEPSTFDWHLHLRIGALSLRVPEPPFRAPS